MKKEEFEPYDGMHDQIWRAIDRLAASFGYSASGLAKQAGLDATAFNKSKRTGPDGKPRWPSTESLARILAATGARMSDFLSLMDEPVPAEHKVPKYIPMIGFARAGTKGFFDEDGYPRGDAWDEVAFPNFDPREEENVYALEITGTSMEPLYREGDVIVVSPHTSIRRGDRVVVKTRDGEVMAKELIRQTAGKIDLKSLNAQYETRSFGLDQISWIARILWVSQ